MSAFLLLAAAATITSMRFSCTLALLLPNGQLTDSAAVSVRFDSDGKELRDIHVVDAGGILYPGGNMAITHTPGATNIGAAPVPAERPGTWTGKVEKKMYRLQLTTDAAGEATELTIGRAPVGNSGRLGVIWHASHQPDGLSRPITGQGVGQCGLPTIGAAQ